MKARWYTGNNKESLMPAVSSAGVRDSDELKRVFSLYALKLVEQIFPAYLAGN